MVKALLIAIKDSPGLKERCPAFLNCLNHIGRSLNVEKSALLPGEGGLWQVFSSGRGPDCHRALVHFLISLLYLVSHAGGHRCLTDHLHDLKGGLLEHLGVFGFEDLEVSADLFGQLGFLQELEVGIGGDYEAWWDRDPGLGHFSQIGSLATGDGYVCFANLLEPGNHLRGSLVQDPPPWIS